MATGTTRGPYAKTAAVRRGIIHVAIDAFGESGYWGTTMKEIAERAGISQRGLVHHFANKEELLEQVLAAREDESATMLPEPGGEIDSFAAMLTVVADNSRRPGLVELYTVLTAEGASEKHPAHDHYRQRYVDLRTYFAAAFETLRVQGELDSTQDSETLASAFVALIDGSQLQWLYDRTSIDMDQVLRGHLVALIPRYAELTAAATTTATAH